MGQFRAMKESHCSHESQITAKGFYQSFLPCDFFRSETSTVNIKLAVDPIAQAAYEEHQ